MSFIILGVWLTSVLRLVKSLVFAVYPYLWVKRMTKGVSPRGNIFYYDTIAA